MLFTNSCNSETANTARSPLSASSQGADYPEITIMLDYKALDFQETLLQMIQDELHLYGNSTTILLERVGGAMTNRVYYLTSDSSPKLVLRLYGEGIERLVSISDELRLMRRLHRMGRGPRILLTFMNGRIEEYIEGFTLSSAHLRTKSIEIAKCMSEVHAMRFPFEDDPFYQMTIQEGEDAQHGNNAIWERIYRWRHEALERTVKEAVVDSEVMHYLSEDFLLKVNQVQSEVVALNPDTCFCHNDLQHGNILCQSPRDTILFVDYEYAGRTTPAYDIANHFCEWMADYLGEHPEQLSVERFPSREQQEIFLEAYNNAFIEAREPRKPVTIEQVSVCVDVSHLHWGYWALLQAGQSSIAFNYTEYAKQRFRLMSALIQ